MSPDAPVSLVLPFGAIGLVGGWLTADSFHLPDRSFHCLLAGVTPVVAGLLGHYLTGRIGGVGSDGAAASSAGAGWADGPGRWTRRGPIAASLLVLWAIVVAGVVNGMTVGLVLGPAGMIIGAPFGAVFSLPFVPALAAVLLAANRVGRARAGSIVARADRRAVWSATAAVIAAAALMAPALFGKPAMPEVGRVVAALGIAVVGAVFMVDAVALAKMLALPRREMGAGAMMEEMVEGEGEDGGARSGARGGGRGAGMGETIDLGLGDDVQVEVVRPTHAYRGAPQIARVVRGSRERAAGALRAGLARGGIALAVGAALWGGPWT
ncbi:hypothetical protein [Sorangium sp. So ce1078]|uniref:hypothetical protein n=1 Tax=Sorangium sp. So ce1078 TaxID=3133329 RepID=UPI003F5DCA11